MINIENLNKKFGKLVALKNINLSIELGGCIALIGPNASGKTTLIKSILGLVIADSGKIVVRGQSVKGEWIYRQHIGYMPQIGRYPDNMTINQLFAMIIDIRKHAWSNCDTELIENFRIKESFDKRMGNLSGGTRQKISACLAFLFNPQILILDEPTAGLDPVSTEILKEKIHKEKTNGKLILITSHVLSELDDLVDEIIYLQDGEINFHKKIELLRKDTNETKLSRAIARVMGFKENV